ncbi:nucleoside-diphosphate-sugar epimerase [Nocardia sp. GAS34]|uniref:SDR family oxidoreductase n=1 Tax=unclassified Nocardia TaxID=2637762 RepID=UPI003D1A8EFA
MRIFVTGATGGIGSAVVPELIGAGHEVVGLARSDGSAAKLAGFGAAAIRGDLDDADALRSGARDADGVIHLAFGNDFTNIEANMAQEALAVEVFTQTLRDTGKALVIASGTPVAPGRVATEEDEMPMQGPLAGRARNAKTVLASGRDGIRSAVVRLPRSVHGRNPGDGYGFAGMLIRAARATGVSGYVGDGSQRWPAVHRLDAARLFRLVTEQATPGSVAHAVADEGDSMLTLAETIGRELGLPVASVPAESFGFLGQVFSLDQPSSSVLTRKQFGWEPTHPSLLEDLASGNYPE